jgi:hypothetical protein
MDFNEVFRQNNSGLQQLRDFAVCGKNPFSVMSEGI